MAGQGVAISTSTLAAADLAAGRLVRPFDLPLSEKFAYFLVYPEATAERPKIAAFREWIMAEARAYMEAEGIDVPEFFSGKEHDEG